MIAVWPYLRAGSRNLGVPTTEELQELDQIDIDVREISARNFNDEQLALTTGATEDEH